MLLIVGSLILGLFNLGVIIGMKKQLRIAPWAMLALQVPWTLYDVLTAQYGFLILSVACTITALSMIRSDRKRQLDA